MVDATTQPAQDAAGDREHLKLLHGVLGVTWLGMLLAGVVLLALGIAAQNDGYASGPLDPDAQAGGDYLIAGLLGLGAVLGFAVHIGVLIVQTTLCMTLRQSLPPDETADSE